jgi:hypothetical protein
VELDSRTAVTVPGRWSQEFPNRQFKSCATAREHEQIANLRSTTCGVQTESKTEKAPPWCPNHYLLSLLFLVKILVSD